MTPIISPWVVYIIGVADKIQPFLFLTWFLGICLSLFLAICCFNDEDYIKWLKYCIIFDIAVWLLFIFTPDRTTCIAMLATFFVTPDNIQLVQGNVVDFVWQLTEAIASVK